MKDTDVLSENSSSPRTSTPVPEPETPQTSDRRLGRSTCRQSSAPALAANRTPSAKRCPSRVRDTFSNMNGAGEGVPRVTSATAQFFTDEALKSLLGWLDKIPFTRQRKHIHRDFSDGVLMAELIAHFFPKMIELHNYAGANNTNLKKNNWDLLNRKILPKLGIKLQDPAIDSVCLAKPGYIEQVLNQIRKLIEKKSEEDELAKARELALSTGGDCGDGSGSSATPLTEEKCLVHVVPDEVPEFVVFRGRKYFPEESVEEKNKAIEELREKNKELTNKARRLETLVNLKEKHLEDLTRQLHELRMRQGTHECVCKFDDGEEPQYSVFN